MQLLWAGWLREKLLAPVPHRHVVLTMPRLLRPLFRRRRELLGELSQAGAEAIRGGLGEDIRPGIVVSKSSDARRRERLEPDEQPLVCPSHSWTMPVAGLERLLP